MRNVLGAVGLVSLLSTSCGSPDSPNESNPPECGAACLEQEACVLATEAVCEFAEPSQWLLFDALAGAIPVPEPGGRVDLLAFPAALADSVTPLVLSEGALDEEFWGSFDQRWSPDGQMLVFDSTKGVDFESLQNMLFVTEFGRGLPTQPRPIESLPRGGLLTLGAWDARSTAFPVVNDDELYVIHRDGSELNTTLAARGDSAILEAYVCAGGEYVVYDLETGELAIAPADVAGETGRVHAEHDVYALSPNDELVTVATRDLDTDTYSLTLGPCGAGDERLLLDGRASPLWPSFSPDSRYLLVEDGAAPLGYFDLAEPASEMRTFPDGANLFYGWSNDASYGLLGTDAGQLLTYHPDTGASSTLPFPDGGWTAVGELLLYEHVDRADGPSTYLLVDLLAPAAPLLTLSADEMSQLQAIEVDQGETSIAYALAGESGSLVKIVDLRDSTLVTTFEFPRTLDLTLGPFTADGKGIVATVSAPRFELYWLSNATHSDSAEPRLVHEALGGDLLSQQPWP